MAFTPVSGKDGSFKISTTKKAEITAWTLVENAVTTRFGSSESAGYQKSEPGSLSADGSFEAKWDSTASTGGNSAYAVGSKISDLRLYLDATHYYAFASATVKSCRTVCDVNTGAVIGISVTFENNGTYSQPTF